MYNGVMLHLWWRQFHRRRIGQSLFLLVCWLMWICKWWLQCSVNRLVINDANSLMQKNEYVCSIVLMFECLFESQKAMHRNNIEGLLQVWYCLLNECKVTYNRQNVSVTIMPLGLVYTDKVLSQAKVDLVSFLISNSRLTMTYKKKSTIIENIKLFVYMFCTLIVRHVCCSHWRSTCCTG